MRVTAKKGHLWIEIKPAQLCTVLSNETELPAAENDGESNIQLEARYDLSSKGSAGKLLTESVDGSLPQPDPVLLKAIARARAWFDQLTTGKAKSMAEIAARENTTDNYVSNLIHLTWLPPSQIELIFSGDAVATKLARTAMHNRRIDLIWTTNSA